MTRLIKWMAIAALFVAATAQSLAQDANSVLKTLNWIAGPQVVSVGSNATFRIPKGFVFLDATDTKRYMEATKNSSYGELYYFGPDDGRWWAIFRYEATGYVPDDEKIDADALIRGMRENQEQDNKARQAKGWPMLLNTDWKFPPFYDPATKRLEWAISFVNSATNRVSVNYDTRLLARGGVTSATLAANPDALAIAVPEFKAAVAGYDFVAGQRYTEFKKGDKVAEFGLAALVAGGAAAALAKVGFFAKFWKILVGVGVALIAALGQIFKRKDKA